MLLTVRDVPVVTRYGGRKQLFFHQTSLELFSLLEVNKTRKKIKVKSAVLKKKENLFKWNALHAGVRKLPSDAVLGVEEPRPRS